MDQKEDQINHPKHYTFSKLEPIDVIEEWELDYHLGNVFKYIARSPYKGNELEDLKKARWYLDRKIDKLVDIYNNGIPLEKVKPTSFPDVD